MRRMYDLVKMTRESHPEDQFFANLDDTLRSSSQARAQYRTYDRALSYLDAESWDVLSKKAIAHFQDHRSGQKKQGFFFQLNEAFAYQFLIRRGYKGVAVLREDGATKPDITYLDGADRHFCEVKSIGVSDAELKIRDAKDVYDLCVYQELSAGFLNKLGDAIRQAGRQISSQGNSSGLVFVVAQFDDFTLDHYSNYRKQISQFLSNHDVPEVFIKIGLGGSRYIHKRANQHKPYPPN